MPTGGDQQVQGEPVGPLPRPSLKLTGVFLVVVLAGLVTGWLLTSSDQAPEVASVGEPAPDFDVELLTGGEFVLSEQLSSDDRPIVLNLWASWCLPCREETPDISAFAEAHPEVKVIGVSVEDTEGAAREFAEEFSPVYDLALGDAQFDKAYPRLGLPVTYIIGADGVVEEWFNGIVNTQVLEELVLS